MELVLWTTKLSIITEENPNDKLPTGIGDDSYLSPSVINGDLKMVDVSGGNCYMENHTLSQQERGSNTGDMSSRNGFINRHTLSKCDDLGTFKEMVGNVENGDVSSGIGFMNNYTVYKLMGLK